jgi:hypothetical protein
VKNDDGYLDTEPWFSAVPDEQLKMQPNVKWNGVEATHAVCRDVIKAEGTASLARLTACATDQPLQNMEFPNEDLYVSTPPSLEHLDTDADSSTYSSKIKY